VGGNVAAAYNKIIGYIEILNISSGKRIIASLFSNQGL